MIKLGTRPSAPPVLSSPKISRALAYLENQLHDNGGLSSEDFKSRNYWTAVKRELSEYQNGKCCFCERGRDPNRETDVEHFRPKLSVGDEPAPSHNGYWWLAYSWHNLFFVCSECNSIYKKNSFPLLNEPDRAFTKDDDITREKPYLLNPCEDDPEQFIIYDYTNRKVPMPVSSATDIDGRGHETIELLGLAKRPQLIAERAEKLVNMRLFADSLIHMKKSDKDYGDDLNECINSIKSHVSAKSTHAGFARFFYKQMGLDAYINDDTAQ